MTNKIFWAVMASLCTRFGHTQESSLALHPDQKCFNFVLHDLPGSTKTETSLADLKGRFLILDFFSSTCTVCFRMLPKINTLQKQFQNNLDFILVGIRDDQIEKVYERFSEKFHLDLKVVYEESLHKRFSVDFVPYYIWIDDNGVVQATTGPDEVTAENIAAFLSRKPVVQSRYSNSKIPFDYNRLFLVNDNGAPDSSFLFRSVLSAWTPALATSSPVRIDSCPAPYSFQALGVSLAQLYNYAYWGKGYWSTHDTLYTAVYPTPIIAPGLDSLFKINPRSGQGLYCYSLSVPPRKFRQSFLQNLLRKDLERFFELTVTVQKRPRPCWVLRATEDGRRHLLTKSTAVQQSFSQVGFCYSNVPVSVLVETLQYCFQDQPPFLDETGILGKIDIRVDAVLASLSDVRAALEKAGLKLSLEERVFTTLVLKQNE